MHDKRNITPMKTAKLRKHFAPPEIRARNEFSWQEEKVTRITWLDLVIGLVVLATTLAIAANMV